MRVAFLLTTDPQSARAQFSKETLENIGFKVVFYIAIANNDKVLSNKLSMLAIYNEILIGNSEWGYVFEDDVNVVEPIHLNEIVQYEKISSPFFYLGCCMMNNREETVNNTGRVINNHPVMNVSGQVRGLHGIGITRLGAKELIEFANASKERYMDCILESFSQIYPANIVRYDLQSPLEKGHRGVLFQDRQAFPPTIR